MRHPKNSSYPKKFKPLNKESTGVSKTNARSKDIKRSSAPRIADGHRLVVGRNASREMLQRSQERVVRCFSSIGAGADSVGKDIVSAAHARGIPVSELDRDSMDELSSGSIHQGICLEVKERSFLDLQTLIDIVEQKSNSIILALDNVQDPQNLGSILRAAECLGVEAVIWSKNRGADLTPAAAKVSVGASEIVPIAKVGNLRDALGKLKNAGYWVAATVVSPDAQKLGTFSFPEKTVLVMGGEGDGVQPLIAKEADFRVYIQQHGVIDSLNVSQATAVFLAEYQRQRLVVDKKV